MRTRPTCSGSARRSAASSRSTTSTSRARAHHACPHVLPTLHLEGSAAPMPTVSTSSASERQIAANRANAKKSTGPRTPEGRARAAMNALKDGVFARTPLLPGEAEDDHQAMVAELVDDLAPAPHLHPWTVPLVGQHERGARRVPPEVAHLRPLGVAGDGQPALRIHPGGDGGRLGRAVAPGGAWPVRPPETCSRRPRNCADWSAASESSGASSVSWPAPSSRAPASSF